ncbi:MAG: DNA primase, partial [Paracoccaceae bacterium]
MSLPDGFLDELRGRASLAQVVGRKLSWDTRKSNQAKGDIWAPCPFHQEKTASFHVDDRQGFYYCFGCHAKGDAISFVRETENVGFIEAVEILAREVGMPMPARDAKAAQKADHRARLVEVMEAAVQFFRLQLKTAAGGAARNYLAGRGLDEAALARWEIGFAPDNRQALWTHLTGKGVAGDRIIDAGLAARPDDGGAPYDRFRDRIIFPIRDPRGRAIALGGRAMAANARAKYLNSPETPLFDKGRTLFNHQHARTAVGNGAPLIVVEGYMDAIALAQSGFDGVVAPLGTAITEDQLRLLWRLGPEPIIALDGDIAGLRAAMRLVDVALPILEAGQSLRFAIMPGGQDPDDVIKSGGAAAMQELLDQAQPMVRLLWRRETEGKVFDSPERKAALDKSLRAAIQRITDKSIRAHYGQEIKDLRWQLFGAGRAVANNRRNWGAARGAAPMAQPATRGSYLASGTAQQEYLREAVILAVLLANPEIIETFESELDRLQMSNGDHATIRAAILRHCDAPPDNFRALVENETGAAAIEKLFGLGHVQIVPAVRNPDGGEVATLCIAQELAKLATRRAAPREIAEAARDLEDISDESITWRLGQAGEARNVAERSQTEDKTEYEISDSGALINHKELKELD